MVLEETFGKLSRCYGVQDDQIIKPNTSCGLIVPPFY